MRGCTAIKQKEWPVYRCERDEGASPLFPPHYPDASTAREALLHIVRREPRLFGHPRARWGLAQLVQTCDWLRVATLPGMWQVLKRLGIHYKRARSYIHSPDERYDTKLALIQKCLQRTQTDPERFVFLYQDECSYYRQPSLARAYAARGVEQPLAYWSVRSNTRFRVVAALNAFTGQVTYRQHSRISRQRLAAFYIQLQAEYPQAEEIYLVQDNWPLHFHPDVLACLQPQDSSWFPQLPDNWPSQPRPSAVRADLPIRLLCLPTYASWLNPIEKLWRWLKQEQLHLHRYCDDWPTLRALVAQALDQFRSGSPDLLRYVGLLPD